MKRSIPAIAVRKQVALNTNCEQVEMGCGVRVQRRGIFLEERWRVFGLAKRKEQMNSVMS